MANQKHTDEPCMLFVSTTYSYQCNLFHLHEIHLCTCSYRIPGCCYTQHKYHICVLLWYTHWYLKQQKESYCKAFHWNGVLTKLFSLSNIFKWNMKVHVFELRRMIWRHDWSLQLYTQLKQSWNLSRVYDKITRFWMQIVTSAVYSISIKSIFASAVIGSPGVVTNSISITAVCSVSTLVSI